MPVRPFKHRTQISSLPSPEFHHPQGTEAVPGLALRHAQPRALIHPALQPAPAPQLLVLSYLELGGLLLAVRSLLAGPHMPDHFVLTTLLMKAVPTIAVSHRRALRSRKRWGVIKWGSERRASDTKLGLTATQHLSTNTVQLEETGGTFCGDSRPWATHHSELKRKGPDSGLLQCG